MDPNRGGGYIIIEDKQLLINSGTASGYEVAVEGDGINYSFAKSTTRRGRVGKQKAQTLDQQVQQGVYYNGAIRRFTEIEAERLQGFPDDWTKFGNYENGPRLIPKAQRYKLIGNAVTTHCSKQIGKKLIQ
jgi:DNA (cytosine-5)-methyltransferase 1